MAAISHHPEDKKRNRGILSIFSRKTKSSAGESSLSSGSAGERSVSPARSDESTDGRPTPRPISATSSTATLTHSQGPPHPPLPRAASSLSLAKSRKRQAPAPPPVAPSGAQPAKVGLKNQQHANGKSLEGGGIGSSTIIETKESNRSPDQGVEDQSPYTSPSGSEISSIEAARPHRMGHTTNLTTVSSASNLSLTSRGKRRAPPPPKPPPSRHEDLPSAIPEESESLGPIESEPSESTESTIPVDDGEEKTRRNSVRSPSPASSQVSSVSSLSSVEHHGTTSPQPTHSTPCKEGVGSPPTPPPPSSDHEVQTQNETFSSETSEEGDSDNVVTGKGMSNGKSIQSNGRSRSESESESTESSGDSDNLKEIAKQKLIAPLSPGKSESSTSDDEEKTETSGPLVTAQVTISKTKLEDERKSDSSHSSSSSDENKSNVSYQSNDKKDPSKVPGKELTTSQLSDDSDRELVDRTGEAVRDQRMTVNQPLSSVRLPTANEISNKDRDAKLLNLTNDRHRKSTVDSSSRGSLSSSSSSSLSQSFDKSSHNLEDDDQHNLMAHLSQQISKKKMEIHLEAAFADMSDTEVKANIELSPPPARSESSEWEYKIPDPPTPFKDSPASRVVPRASVSSSSTLSEPLPEVLSDVPSGFNDSPSSSIIAEAKNIDIIDKVESDIEIDVIGETSDCPSPASSRKSTVSSRSSIKSFDEKLNVKKANKAINNNEPRIIELTPKVRVSDNTTAPVIQCEDLPARVNHHVEQSFVPKVKAKIQPDFDSLDKRDTRKQIMESTSSSDSFSDAHDGVDTSPRSRSSTNAHDQMDSSSSRSRSSTDVSYESAPPPAPDGPPPSDSDSDWERTRSSTNFSETSSASVGSASKTSHDTTDSSSNRSRVMNFSISTYKSRSEERSYDKKIAKSDSFSTLQKIIPSSDSSITIKSSSSSSLRDQPEPKSYVDELIEKDKPPPLPEKTSNFAHNASVISRILNLRQKSQSQQHLNQVSSWKPEVPPKRSSLQGYGRGGSSVNSQSVMRMNSLSDKHEHFGSESRLASLEPTRPPRRLQRTDSQERLGLGRATSLSNLATPDFELRKAQSSTELSYGSGGTTPSTAGTVNSGEEMPIPGMMGMPMGMSMMAGMPQVSGGAVMPNDARLADEFVKLQQDFFKWQQQLLQNQHVLHSRVAPLASNPPANAPLQSMSDNGQNGAQPQTRMTTTTISSSGGGGGPVERIIPIKMEMTTTTTTSYGGNELRPGAMPSSRLSRSMQDIASDMGQLSTGDNSNLFNRMNQFQQQQQPPHEQQQQSAGRRWAGQEPSVSVGAWNERPSQAPVGVFQDQDSVTSQPKSRSTQDLSSVPPSQPRPGAFQNNTQGQQPPSQFQSLPPQQQRQFAQFLQQQQQQQQQPQQDQLQQQQKEQLEQERQQQIQQQRLLQQQRRQQEREHLQQMLQPKEVPDRSTFWQNQDTNKQVPSSANIISQEPTVQPTRPPRTRNSPPQEDLPAKPLTYFGQDTAVNEPPQTYYFSGDGTRAPDNVPGAGPRYTSVVTVADQDRQGGAYEAPPKDKVRSVVQLNSDQQKNANNLPMKNTPAAPVVRGFRQPGEENNNIPGSNSFHSKIMNSANRNQQQPTSVLPSTNAAPVIEAPTAARLVAAAQASAPKEPSPVPLSTRISPPKFNQQQAPRVSPPRTSPSRSSPPRTSPSSGPAFAGVQLRPVPNSVRSSPPADTVDQYQPVSTPAPVPPMAPAPPPVNQVGSAGPPPPPPAPPMAPPPPPPPAANGERRTASGKRIVSAKTGPELDTREELMIAIRNHGGRNGLRRTGGMPFAEQSS